MDVSTNPLHPAPEPTIGLPRLVPRPDASQAAPPTFGRRCKGSGATATSAAAGEHVGPGNSSTMAPWTSPLFQQGQAGRPSTGTAGNRNCRCRPGSCLLAPPQAP